MGWGANMSKEAGKNKCIIGELGDDPIVIKFIWVCDGGERLDS